MNEKIKEVSKLLFPEKEELKTPSQKIDEILRKKLQEIRTNRYQPKDLQDNDISQFDEKIEEIANFFQIHVLNVGKSQAILDFQVGINLLNGYKKDSIINAKIELEEDADFGEKTFLAFLDVLKNYSNDVVKKYIKLGAINNQIWNTKNNTKIDTDKEIETLTKNLDERGY